MANMMPAEAKMKKITVTGKAMVTSSSTGTPSYGTRLSAEGERSGVDIRWGQGRVSIK